MAAIDRYTFLDTSPEDNDEGLSYVDYDSDYTSADNHTEDELDNSEDGSMPLGTTHFTAGTP